MKKNMQNKNGKKRKIKYKNVLKFILIIFFLGLSFYFVLHIRIKNIYIVNNNFLDDQTIIDLAGLHDYPTLSAVNSEKIAHKLEKNDYIKKAKVKRSHFFREITITIEENRPLLYYDFADSYLLADGKSVKGNYDLPTLINQTPDSVLEKLLEQLDELDVDVLDRISEITYAPATGDDKLFYLTMSDGNDVYININTFSKLNDYIDIIRRFNNKKGTLNLDRGDYLEIYEEN